MTGHAAAVFHSVEAGARPRQSESLYGESVTTQAEISAEIDCDRRGVRGGGSREDGVRLDYPPYRSSLLRHPTKSPQQVDPEGVELWAPVFGEHEVDPAEADLTRAARRGAHRRADEGHRARAGR